MLVRSRDPLRRVQQGPDGRLVGSLRHPVERLIQLEGRGRGQRLRIVQAFEGRVVYA
jgi:hypothetical protein